MLVTFLVQVLATPVERAGHLLTQGVDLHTAQDRGPPPLRHVAETEARQEGMRWAAAGAEPGIRAHPLPGSAGARRPSILSVRPCVRHALAAPGARTSCPS